MKPSLSSRQAAEQKSPPVSARERRFTAISWLVTVLVVASMVALLFWEPAPVQSSAPLPSADANQTAALPEFVPQATLEGVVRLSDRATAKIDHSGETVSQYTVQAGDSIFGIAKEFNLTPETVLWANYDTLNDNPDTISIGLALNIPPTNGVLYEWQAGDTLDAIAARFKAKAEDVVSWSGNNIDLINPSVPEGKLVMIPGGSREFKQWVVPTIPRGRAGVSATILGAGACDTPETGAYGSGTFIWPAGTQLISGNDYWSGHLGLDIGAGEGMAIYASDSGMVVYAGWSNNGYGNMVMIDHGNGYQTLYGHMSYLSVRCGQGVGQGQTLGSAGNTGNSFGAHLHFEVRYLGGFVSPWFVLP